MLSSFCPNSLLVGGFFLVQSMVMAPPRIAAATKEQFSQHHLCWQQYCTNDAKNLLSAIIVGCTDRRMRGPRVANANSFLLSTIDCTVLYSVLCSVLVLCFTLYCTLYSTPLEQGQRGSSWTRTEGDGTPNSALSTDPNDHNHKHNGLIQHFSRFD